MPILFSDHSSAAMRWNSSIEQEAVRRSRGVRVDGATLRDVLLAFMATSQFSTLECSHPPNGFKFTRPMPEPRVFELFGQIKVDTGEAFGSAHVYRDGKLLEGIGFDSPLEADDEVDLDFKIC